MEIILDDGINVSVSDVEKYISEARNRLSAISDFEDQEVISIIEKLSVDEPLVSIAMLSLHNNMPINEVIVKQVTSKGEIVRRKDRKTRARNAFQTTGLTKSARRQIARKTIRTKKANPATQVRAQRKRRKALRKRDAMGIKDGQ